MELVIDTNCLISALIRYGKSRNLLFSPWLSLYAPEYIFSEVFRHRQDILHKSGIAASDFAALLNLLSSRIITVPECEFRSFKDKASTLVKHPEDIPFMALALSKNISLWSDDRALQQQSEVKVYSTPALVTLCGP